MKADTRSPLASRFSELLAEAGLPEDATLDDLIRHHRSNAALATAFDQIADAATINDLFVENRWCHKTGTHGAHNWSDSGREFFCTGTETGE